MSKYKEEESAMKEKFTSFYMHRHKGKLCLNKFY